MSSSNTSPSKTAGQMHSIKGAIKETVGSAIKNANMKETGREEHHLGNAEVRDAKKTKGQGNHLGTTENEGFRGHSSGAGPFSGNDLGQYENTNSGHALGAGAGVGMGAPHNQTQTNEYNFGGPHARSSGPTGEAMTQGYSATGGSAGFMGSEEGPTTHDGLSGNHMNATRNVGQGFANQDAGIADRQTKQDMKEWERNAF